MNGDIAIFFINGPIEWKKFCSEPICSFSELPKRILLIFCVRIRPNSEFLEYILLWEKSYVDFPNFLVLCGNKFCWLNSDPWSWGKDICVQKSSEIDSHSKWSLGITGKVAFIIRKQFNQTKYLMRTISNSELRTVQRIDFRTSSSAQILKHKLSLPFTRDLVDWNIQRSFYVLSF